MVATTTMSILELLDRYCQSTEVSVRYRESLLRTVRKACSSGILNVCQLVPDRVNSFLSGLPLSAVTRGNIRRELLTLWRYSYEEGLTEVYPARIRKIRPRAVPVQTWTREELLALLSCAEADERPISSRFSLRRCDVLPVWIQMGFETGLRFSDILTLHGDSIRNGCVMTTASKTGKATVRRLSPKANQAVRKLLAQSPDGTLFRWCLPRRRALLLWRKFLDDNGFAGSSKWLRRSAATQVEMQQRGAATVFLQHSNAALAYRSYVDVSQLEGAVGPAPLS